MQRALRIAVVVAAAVLGALLTRRALHAWAPRDAVAPPSSDLFHYQAEVELGSTDSEPEPLNGLLRLARRDIDRACEGDESAIASLREQLGDALARSEGDASRVLAEAELLPTQCFEPPNPPGMCVWAAAEVERGGELIVPGWAMLAGCPAGVAAPFFDRADAPAERVLAFVAARRVGSPSLGPPARLPTQYVRAAIEVAGRTEAVSADGGGGALAARYDDAAATSALAQAYESATDAGPRIVLAEAMGVLSNARAQDLVRAACQSIPTLVGCVDATTFERIDLLYDATSYVERHPVDRPRVLSELEGCARGATMELVGLPATCLVRLATIDWARARAVAVELDVHEDPALAGVVHSLTQFPSASALVLALRSRQLLGEPRAASEADPVTVVSAMAGYGRAWTLGPSAFAAFGHDRLARHLLRLGGMFDVEVEESGIDATGAMALLGRRTRLRARSHGDTLATDIGSDGDFYDLDAVVGLLNAVARVRGANVRYLVVVDPLVEEAIVLGPPGELASAVAEGLLVTPSSAPQAPELPF